MRIRDDAEKDWREHTLGADYETSTLLGAAVDCLDNVDEFLLILKHPIQLVVVTSSEIAHDVLIAEEEHDGAGVVEFCFTRQRCCLLSNKRFARRLIRTIHLVKVGDLVDITDIDDGKALDLVGYLVEELILAHAVGVPVAAEADDDETLLLAEDGLVDVPARGQMGNDDRAHVFRGGSLEGRLLTLDDGCVVKEWYRGAEAGGGAGQGPLQPNFGKARFVAYRFVGNIEIGSPLAQ